jgi:hypothetical protein
MDKKIIVIVIMTLLLTTTVNIVPDSLKAEETDTFSPEIASSNVDPETFGYGFNITIAPNVFDNQSGVNLVKVNVTYPDNTYGNYSMNNTNGSIYEYILNNTWQLGQYNYSIWSIDNANNTNITSQHSFNVSAQATVSVCTIKDSYGANETINLTDPPGNKESSSGSSSKPIGYELLDTGEVLHIWNKFDSYYFNTSSGIQLTNHYNNYWSHNILMLGYYNKNKWNLIYRTDELSSFNKDIESDNETYVNANLWKDLSYGGYDFRLAIRYHLGINDNELTVIPYIKNIDQNDIPYVLGFGWEMKDIQIDMTDTGDYIDVNNTMYYLNQTLDKSYTNLPRSEFYLMENITDTETKSLYLKWDNSLNYKLQVKSRNGQYNAPVTLFIRIGTLDSGQEKYTRMYWYDAEQVTYYFDGYDNAPMGESWATNPSYMVDGSTSNYASTTTDGDVELCNSNNCSGTDIGTISKVELRVSSYCSNGQRDTILRPVFGGITDGVEYRYETSITADTWSQWFDITYDPFAPQTWTWTEIDILDCDVIAENIPMGPPFTLKCSKIEIRVTYTLPNYNPVISDPVPADDATGISIQPLLNITISDADGDYMNISWLSNSSGSWQTFGTNNSVSNGTYHQTFINVSENGKRWYWKVNVSDGTDYVESNVYKFYTGCETKIENTGSTNISGYLLMQVQYYSGLLEDWVAVDDTINDDTLRTVNAGGYLALDTIFNGLVNTSKLRYGNGTYRVYVAFRDPNDNVLKCNDNSYLKKSYPFEFNAPPLKWKNLHLKGFDNVNNIATRGIEVYNDELYVGTWNLNKTKLGENLPGNLGCNGFLAGTSIKMADDTYKDIEDVEVDDQVKAYDIDSNGYVTANVTDIYYFSTNMVPDYYVTINNKLHISPNHLLYVNGTLTNASDIITGDYLVDVNGSNVTVSSSQIISASEKMYNLMVSANPEEYDIQDNLTYYAEDIQVYPLGFNGYELIGELIFALLNRVFINLGIRKVFNLGANSSDGCELWRYNYTTNTWTDLVGRNVSGESDYPSGFGDRHNYVIGAMKVLNGKLYVGTWQSPDVGGEIWRYDGSTWEQVVGPNSTMKGGFNNSDNMMLSMEVFKNSTGVTHLYVGTMNFAQGYNGGCQVWRTEDGDTWEQVVNRGFRDFDGTSYITRNIYAWSMEEFNDKLYVGTWNGRMYVEWGCQLWRTSSGVDDWEKVQLPQNNDTGEFHDGFGESDNYGIRRLVNYSSNLYIGTATSPFQVEKPWKDVEAIEVWRYDGTEGWDAWECIIGDDTGASENDPEYDGFGDKYNKYCWSMIACGDELWMGTSNNQFVSDFPIPDYVSKGCEVWNYDGENLTPSVKDDIGEIGNGFGNMSTIGARSMIEFPVGSGNVVVGTYSIRDVFKPEVEELGCEVWIRYA